LAYTERYSCTGTQDSVSHLPSELLDFMPVVNDHYIYNFSILQENAPHEPIKSDPVTLAADDYVQASALQKATTSVVCRVTRLYKYKTIAGAVGLLSVSRPILPEKVIQIYVFTS